MSRPTRDDAIAKHHADREEEFHAILVRTGLRPQGSKVEEFRAKQPAPVAPPVDVAAVLRRQSEAAE